MASVGNRRDNVVPERVLDLCGGTGVVSRGAMARGAAATLLDLNPRPADLGLRYGDRFNVVQGRAEEVDRLLPHDHFHAVICRQAIAYLDIKAVFRAVWNVLMPGGDFVFNTFKKPRWGYQTYMHDGRRFRELSGYLGSRVFHVQACRSLGVDVSFFRWYLGLDITRELVAAGFELGDIFMESKTERGWQFRAWKSR